MSSLDFHRYGDILASGSMDTNVKVCTQGVNLCMEVYVYCKVTMYIYLSTHSTYIAVGREKKGVYLYIQGTL